MNNDWAYNANNDCKHDFLYQRLVNDVLTFGHLKSNRTGVDTFSVFDYTMRFALCDGSIPLLTTKKMHTKSIIHEIIWYLKGADNINYLKDNGVTIWDEWADETGYLGPVYGVQWRGWQQYEYVPAHGFGHNWIEEKFVVNHIDQIANVIDLLKTDPNSRRMIVSAWNVGELDEMALPPCHMMFQFWTKLLREEERFYEATKTFLAADIQQQAMEQSKSLMEVLDDLNVPKLELSMKLHQRSCDVGLGVPFNIAQYSILLRMFCEVTNMAPGEFIWSGNDVHIYVNHIDALREQTARAPFNSPKLRFGRKIESIDDFKYEDFLIEGYQSHPSIKMDVAV